MKSAKLLLLMMCFLIASSLTAAAYEPTNGSALATPALYAIKTAGMEEVVIAAHSLDERSAIPAVPIPAQPSENGLVYLSFLVPFIIKSDDIAQLFAGRAGRNDFRFT